MEEKNKKRVIQLLWLIVFCPIAFLLIFITCVGIFAEIPSTGRTRRLISNPFKSENHMIEYETNGKAWDANALLPTGKEFNL